MKHVAAFVLALLVYIPCFSQSLKVPCEQPVYLSDSLIDSHLEFSGIAKWRDKILLIPQHARDTDRYQILAIDTLSLDSAIERKSVYATATHTIRFGKSLSAIYNAIKAAILPRKDYGGFEGGVAVGDDIFFTVETDSLCFVVKGTIDTATWQVNFKEGDTLSLPKPDYLFANAGYESIAWLPQQHKLIALYENNALHHAPTAYTFTTLLRQKEAVSFQSPLLFRLTDAAQKNGDTLIAINHYYKQYNALENCDSLLQTGSPLRTEYCYYIRNELPQAIREMSISPQQSSFTRLVQLVVKDGKIEWKKGNTISYSADNWEGILPYKKGVLMVVDGRPPGVPCKLSYFALD